MDYSRFISRRAMRRKPALTAAIGLSITRLVDRDKEDIRRFDSGQPNSSHFPIINVAYTLRCGTTFNVNEKLLERSLQYAISLEECQEAIHDIITRTHDPPRWRHLPDKGGAEIFSTTGNTSIFFVLNILMNEGDSVIIEKTASSNIVSEVRAIGCNMLPVAMDDEGMDPESLRQLLSRWKLEDAQDPDSDIPKLLVCVPNHHNPTGAMLSEPRRREIYKLARRYNLIIYEDDSLSFLNYQQDSSQTSFLAMDVDGRVVHANSISGIMAPGFPLGWICMPQTLMNHFKAQHSSVQGALSSFSMNFFVMMYKDWTFEGYSQHIKTVTDFYRGQRDALHRAMTKWMTGLLEWKVPQSGYFIWAKVSNPTIKEEDIFPKFQDIKMSFIERSRFRSESTEELQVYTRINFSKCSAQNMEEGILRLREIIVQAENGPADSP